MHPTILTPTGRLDIAGAPAFEREMLEAVDGGARRLLIDCAGITYISSGGLRAMLNAGKRMRAAGGLMALCGMQPQIAEVFEASGFNTIMAIHADRAAALAALG